jgi:hypothetical protein
MTPDIVERLRDRKEQRYDGPTQDYGWYEDELCHEAAGTIITLRAKLEKAREALSGLLTAPTWADQSPRDMDEEDKQAERAARAAIKEMDT